MEDIFQLSIGLTLGLLVLAYMVFLLFRLLRVHRPSVEFRDLVYNKAAQQLELHVVNSGGRPVYVNPSLRLMHFLDPEEWRGKKSNGGSGVEMLDGRCYGVDSVIKGYTLIGESQGAVVVDGNSLKKIVYPLRHGMNLSLCDNIRVDSHCGFNDASGDLVVDTLRVSVKDGHDGLDGLILEPVSSDRLESNRLFETVSPEGADTVNYLSGGVSSGVEAPSYNPNFCVVSPFEGGKPKNTVENVFPLQAVCVCCGKEKWLEWVVDGNYVCAGCKDFFQDGSGSQDVLSAENRGVVEIEKSLLQDSNDDSSLKPRHREILDLLEHENNLTVRKISRLLSVNESTVSSDLKHLMEKDRVGRVQVGRRYLYHLA